MEVWLEQQSYSKAVSGFKLLMHVELPAGAFSKSRGPGHIPNQLNQKLWHRLSVCLKVPPVNSNVQPRLRTTFLK